MKCIICKKFTFPIICKTCQLVHLKPTRSTRVLPCGFKIYSFYGYEEISQLLKTKHTHIGEAIYKILARNALGEFSNEFNFSETIYAIPIDDNTNSGYSHTAILVNSLKGRNIKPLYSKLRANNSISYSGKSLEYRLKNSRNFNYSFESNINAILVDDIVTSTATLNEAKLTLLKAKVNPLFALTLADARGS